MIGIVLAAGRGTRLGILTQALPKTLLPIDDQRSILDIVLGNLKRVGINDIVIVTGHQSSLIEEAVPRMERDHGVNLRFIFNTRYATLNNAYSLWCARDLFSRGVLLVNGDTVHPQVVEERVMATQAMDLILAVDRSKPIAREAMKVKLSPGGALKLITKDMDVARADGEYIGVALIRPTAAGLLAAALERTWRRDASLYYEDGFQELVRCGAEVGTASIKGVDWVEVDDFADLARARELAHCC
jgi:choline kinase